MEILGPARPAPSPEELITTLAPHIQKVMTGELADEADLDRVYILRKIFKAYLYYRDLAYFAPALFQGLVDSTGIDGTLFPNESEGALYDYTQNVYRGYCRKLEAVLGTRIPNAVAVPNDPSDEKDIAAARAANDAAQYIRQHCELPVQILWLIFSLFNFGTSFWSIEWVVDPSNGWKEISAPEETESLTLGGGVVCPECGEPAQPGDTQCANCGADLSAVQPGPSADAQVPKAMPPQRVPKGALEIDVTDGSEVSVPLDADGRKGTDDCLWIRREREKHKAKLLAKYGDAVRKMDKDSGLDMQSVSSQYGESVRSAMASPIGVVRPRRENRWTVVTEDWQTPMYELVDDAEARQLLKDNFPEGLRITAVRNQIVDLEGRRVEDHWQACQPEPTKRIMADPLGDDWITTQDILNNLLNQQNETVERANEPGFADPTRVDLDAYQRRRSQPTDLIPAVPPAGRTLADIIYRPPANEYSEQIPVFRQQVENTSKETSGLLDPIWGGDTSDPTARQTELKTNAAIRQLGVVWALVGKSLEGVYAKACKLLADNEDGVLSFSKKNQFGRFDTVAVVIEDLKGGEYHFEADEAIPMTWGQQRDLLMWMLDKPAEILKAWGLDDPLNIHEFKTLLGMPGMRVPHLDSRDKAMAVIGELLTQAPVPGPPGPDGQPGPSGPSITPDWEDDNQFFAKLVQAYLTDNFELKTSNPQAYENIQLYGQAQMQIAMKPPPPPPAKASVAVALKGPDLGDPAITAALQKAGITPPGTPAAQQPMPHLRMEPGGRMPPPGATGPAATLPSPGLPPVPSGGPPLPGPQPNGAPPLPLPQG